MTPALQARSVSVHYGEVKAVDGVSFSLEEGTILGIIGPNGAGKTSLVDALSGFTPLARGSVEFRGRDIGDVAPHVRSQLGLARTWQSVELYEDLTVHENLLVAADRPGWWTMLADVLRPGRRVAHHAVVEDLLSVLDLREVADRHVSEIPQDRRKLVGIARALASKPSVVLLDEPAAGLDTEETTALGHQLRRLARGGLAMLLIEHDMELVLSVCDRIVVLDFGRPIAEGTPEDVINNPQVVTAYLGSAGSAGAPASAGTAVSP